MAEEIKPTQEQMKMLEKQLGQFLDDMLTTLIQARDLSKKLGFSHLGNTLNASVETIRIYQKEYKEQKEKNAKQKL